MTEKKGKSLLNDTKQNNHLSLIKHTNGNNNIRKGNKHLSENSRSKKRNIKSEFEEIMKE
jgi:hypothetical protein